MLLLIEKMPYQGFALAREGTPRMQEKIQPLISEQRLPKRHLLWWCMPTLFAWPSSFLCIGYVGALLFGFVPLAPGAASWQVPVFVGAVLALLVVDRVEY